jgi:hypothetical protein
MHRRVIDGDPSLSHHLFQIPETEIVGQIPPHAEQDYRAIEVTAFEHHKSPELAGDIDRTELLMGLRQFPLAWSPAMRPMACARSTSARLKACEQAGEIDPF